MFLNLCNAVVYAIISSCSEKLNAFSCKKVDQTIAYSKKVPTFAPVIETITVSTTKKGAIAQLVEQRTENPCVPGSIPGGTTFTKRKIMKTAEIQLFKRFFLYVSSAKMCNPVQ